MSRHTDDIKTCFTNIAINPTFAIRRLDMEELLTEEVKNCYENLCVFLRELQIKDITGQLNTDDLPDNEG